MKVRYFNCLIFSISASLNSANAKSLSPYPFTKIDFENGWSSLAVHNNAGTVIAARTLSWTSAVQSSLVSAQSYQFDFVTTLTRVSGQPTINAESIRNSTARIYLSSSLANFNAKIYIGTILLNVSDFVDANRNSLTTYAFNGGSQFNPSLDLGNDFFGEANLSMSCCTKPQQTLELRSIFQTLPLNSTAIIGVSFASNADEGFMSLTSTTTDLGNDVVEFGVQNPSESLGFRIEARPFPSPLLSINILPASAQLSMMNLLPGRSYRVMESGSLTGWNQLHIFTAPTSSPPALPTDPVSLLWATPIHPSGQRFYRLEWDN
jgi:hypothetical protein